MSKKAQTSSTELPPITTSDSELPASTSSEIVETPITNQTPPPPLHSSSTSSSSSNSPSSSTDFLSVTLPFNHDFFEIRKQILDLPPKQTFSQEFATQHDLDQFLLYISDAFKKKSSGMRNFTCQCNETKSANPNKKPANATTISELQSPSRNRKSKLIPKSQQCEASLKLDKDPNIVKITVTAHTCSKQFPKFPKFLTDAIDRLLEAQLAAGSSPPVARSVINAHIRSSVLISLASQSSALTKHINNRCMKLIKPPAGPKAKSSSLTSSSPVASEPVIPSLTEEVEIPSLTETDAPSSVKLEPAVSVPTSTEVPDLASVNSARQGSTPTAGHRKRMSRT